jgi:hypothetical protein
MLDSVSAPEGRHSSLGGYYQENDPRSLGPVGQWARYGMIPLLLGLVSHSEEAGAPTLEGPAPSQTPRHWA